MNEAGLAMRVPPCAKRGCGFSVVHHQIQLSCSRFLPSRVERFLRLASGSVGKSVTNNYDVCDVARSS